MIKSWTTKLAGRNSCESQKHKTWQDSFKGGHHLQDVGIDGKMILKRILQNYDFWCGVNSGGPR